MFWRRENLEPYLRSQRSRVPAFEHDLTGAAREHLLVEFNLTAAAKLLVQLLQTDFPAAVWIPRVEQRGELVSTGRGGRRAPFPCSTTRFM